ncbi:MAG: cytochrome c-type biogenesis protein CcmH [Acidimicrobiia bacterium]|nr:cytochrome c-type biogenesis protein CcmH [Acidimicrobiia bacterium]MBT8217284.1 cytochrome c-type biogenesis protein CcmH [Acidimicrobiia bacterium]NNF08872.1 cytochrome c-type biogenesis protein CcmH [Acidimicrobiia bacterium]NNL70945.1 cytochrome c-type biogenesis protein CcmH [Acidimicrobiia bacterium]
MTALEETDERTAGAIGIRRMLVSALTVVLAAIVIGGIVAGPDQGGDRVESLSALIKCPQCRGESIKDSSALTARTMRTIVAEQVADGRSDDEILDYFRNLYGDQAILSPGLSATTVALWAVPGLALIGGVGLIIWLGRSRR